MLGDPDAAYYLDNYGTCTAAKCTCRQSGWIGRACQNWRTFGATNLEELSQAQRSLKCEPSD